MQVSLLFPTFWRRFSLSPPYCCQLCAQYALERLGHLYQFATSISYRVLRRWYREVLLARGSNCLSWSLAPPESFTGCSDAGIERFGWSES